MTREPIEAPLRDGKAPAHKATPQAIDAIEQVMESEGVLLGEEVIRVLSNIRHMDPAPVISPSRSPPPALGVIAWTMRASGRRPSAVPARPDPIGNIAPTSANTEIFTEIGLKLNPASPLTDTLFVTLANGRANSGDVPNDTAFGEYSSGARFAPQAGLRRGRYRQHSGGSDSASGKQTNSARGWCASTRGRSWAMS